MKKVTAYMATDGTLHYEAAQCAAHELDQRLRPMIAKFLDEDPDSRNTSARNRHTALLLNWEVFKQRLTDTPQLEGQGG